MLVKWWGLGLVVAGLVGGITYWQADKTELWEASVLYTVAPKLSTDLPDGPPSGLAYTDIQAANFFIDTIRSWISSPQAHAVYRSANPEVGLPEVRRRSMQTFALVVQGTDRGKAEAGVRSTEALIAQALARYNASGEMIKFSAYSDTVGGETVVPHPLFDSLIAALAVLVLSSGLLGLAYSYRKLR